MSRKIQLDVSQCSTRAARDFFISCLRRDDVLDKDTIDQIEFALEYETEPEMRREFEEGDTQSLEDCVNLEDTKWWKTNIKSL